jgi:recombination protein RecA
MAKKSASDKLIEKIELENAEPQKKSLSQIAAKLNTKNGTNSAKAEIASKKKGLVRIPTGILPLDYALRGGFPRGRVVLLGGRESSWKSTICLRTIAQVQKLGGTAAYIDAERTFDPDWAVAQGVILEQLLILEPETAEQAYNNMTTVILEGIDVVVLDSLNTLSVKKEMWEDDKGSEVATIEKEAMGIAQRKTSQFLRNNLGRISKAKTLLMVIAQIRDSLAIGPYGNPEVVVGGHAIKFASSITLATRQMTAKDKIYRDNENNIVGKTFSFKVDKNKTGREGIEDEFIAYGSTLDNYTSMLKIGLKEGFIQRPNNKTYICNGKNFNGKAAMLEGLVDDSTGLYDFCEKMLFSIMGTKVYAYNPYEKKQEIEDAAAIEINEDDEGTLIPDEELDKMAE